MKKITSHEVEGLNANLLILATENSEALVAVWRALAILKQRTRDRISRNVEGKLAK